MDSFTKRIFKNKIFDKTKLSQFGFKHKKDDYIFIKKILDGQFELTVTVSGKKDINTQLVDCVSGDLYTLHLVENAVGTFVGNVREEYEKILTSIAEHCCSDTYFVFPQANRLTELIKQKYNDTPEFLWENLPGFGVFRNPESAKWYALISRIDKSKLEKKSHGEVEILNIKLDTDEIIELHKVKGFYPAYHMNKKYWITIILDDTISDKKIMDLIEKSHVFSQNKKTRTRNERLKQKG